MPKPLQGLIEDKVLAIISTLSRNSSKFFHLNSLSQAAKVPLTSTHRLIKRLVKSNFVKTTKVGKLTLYQIETNEKTQQLQKLL